MEKAVVELKLTNSGFTSTYQMHLLFSLVKRKFIKPVRALDLSFYYRVLEGRYLFFACSGRWSEPMRIKAAVVTVQPSAWESGKIKEEKWCHIYADKEHIDRVPNELVRDVVMARPGYHRYPRIDFDKIYSEETVKEVLDLIAQGKTVYFVEIES